MNFKRSFVVYLSGVVTSGVMYKNPMLTNDRNLKHVARAGLLKSHLSLMISIIARISLRVYTTSLYI